MVDSLSLKRAATLHPKLRGEIPGILAEISEVLTGRSMFRITFGLRTFAEQDALYKQGRTKPGQIVTKAKAGQSLHNYGFALDFAFVIDGKEASWDEHKDWDNDKIADWMEVVAIFEKHGWEWGGRSKTLHDGPHFQKTFGHDWPDLLALHNAGKVDKDGYVII